MKKLSLLLLLLSLSVGAFASKDTEARAKTLTEGLEKSLALTPDQKAKMYTLVLAKMDAIETLKKQPAGEERDKSIMIERRKFMTEIKSVLTENQFNLWQQLRSEQVPLLKKGEKVPNAVIEKELENTLN